MLDWLFLIFCSISFFLSSSFSLSLHVLGTLSEEKKRGTEEEERQETKRQKKKDQEKSRTEVDIIEVSLI